jgi:hypothetical protein
MCISMTLGLKMKHLTYGNHSKESRGVIEIHVFDRICLFFLRPSWRVLRDATHVNNNIYSLQLGRHPVAVVI